MTGSGINSEFELSDREFERIRGLVKAHTAIELSDEKRQLVFSRFSRRLRALGLTSFSSYCDLVERGNSSEISQFASAITTNFTGFFRESHHFQFLTEQLQAARDIRRLRIWSAGCSTGEEPYSIAITLLDAIPDAARRDIRILATDVDAIAISHAARGIYSEDRIAHLTHDARRRWFRRGRGQFKGQVRVARNLQSLIRFKELNLFRPWPMRGPFDIIFCRNVVIYFGTDAKVGLFRRFADILKPDGCLVVGHSENLANLSDRFESVGNTIYRRVPVR